MKAVRPVTYTAILAIWVVAFLCSCAPQAEPLAKPVTKAEKAPAPPPAVPAAKVPEAGAIKLALQPIPGDATSYKLTSQAKRSIKWEGPVPDKQAFEESFNDDRLDMEYTELIQAVDANGRAGAQITIDRLKCISIVKNETVLDFDSSRPSDANNPLSKLIGQAYSIEFSFDNRVPSVFNLSGPRSLMAGGTAAERAGLTLLSPESIIDRQTGFALPPADADRVKPGDKWSRVKTFPFGMMGLKSYEKIFTLNRVERQGVREIAIVDMNAIPTSEVERRYLNQKAGADFPRMFDTAETFTGTGRFDVTAGKVDGYHEQLQASWIAALPSNAQADVNSTEPVVLRMAATRVLDLERVK